jgi:hypothetical protein
MRNIGPHGRRREAPRGTFGFDIGWLSVGNMISRPCSVHMGRSYWTAAYARAQQVYLCPRFLTEASGRAGEHHRSEVGHSAQGSQQHAPTEKVGTRRRVSSRGIFFAQYPQSIQGFEGVRPPLWCNCPGRLGREREVTRQPQPTRLGVSFLFCTGSAYTLFPHARRPSTSFFGSTVKI